MTLIESNLHDYKPHSFEPKDTFIEKELDDTLAKFKSAEGNITKMMEQIFRICILLNSQGRSYSRTSMEEILPQMLEKAELQAASYKGRHVYAVWTIAIVGSLLTIGGGAYGVAKALPATDLFCTMLSNTGQGFSQGSSLYSETLKGPRELTSHHIQHLTHLRDKYNQAAQSSDGKLGEAQRTLQQLFYALHQIATQIFTGQG
jgi:hypothetical protein